MTRKMNRIDVSHGDDTDNGHDRRRRHPRQRVLKRGLLAFIGGGGVDCTVRNISISGARVDVASPAGIPAQFHLVIETDQFIRRGRPVWSTERQIGIAFD